jgi:hypothetical protein
MWNHLLGITEWKKKDSVYSGGTKVKKEWALGDRQTCPRLA